MSRVLLGTRRVQLGQVGVHHACFPSQRSLSFTPSVQGLTRMYFAHFWSKTPCILTVFWLFGRVNVAPLPHLGWKEKWQLSSHFSGLCILLSTASRLGVNAQLVWVFVPVLQPGICQSGRMINLSSQGGGDHDGLFPPLLCSGASCHCGCPRESLPLPARGTSCPPAALGGPLRWLRLW